MYEQNLARPSRLAQVFVADNIRQFLGTNTGLDRFFCQSCPSITKIIVRSFFFLPGFGTGNIEILARCNSFLFLFFCFGKGECFAVKRAKELNETLSDR